MSFGLDKYDKPLELLKTMDGKVIVSVNDIPETRKALKGCRWGLKINYTVG